MIVVAYVTVSVLMLATLGLIVSIALQDREDRRRATFLQTLRNNGL